MLKTTAQAPTRIDLAGGTLDLWPIHHLLDHKATINVAVTLEAKVDLMTTDDGAFSIRSQDLDRSIRGSYEQVCETTELPLVGLLLKALWAKNLPSLQIVTSAKSPAGAGLGGSSCLAVTLAKALWTTRCKITGEQALSERTLVATAQNVEARLISAPTGCQDYWGAVRGGVNIIRFPYQGEEITTLNPDHVTGLQERLILVFSGKSRASAINNWEIFKKSIDQDPHTLTVFNQIGEQAELCGDALKRGDLQEALNHSKAEWELRITLWPNIETPETIRLRDAARSAGATLSRVCGAGGGGVMAVFAEPENQEAVKSALLKHGGLILPATVSGPGLTVYVG